MLTLVNMLCILFEGKFGCRFISRPFLKLDKFASWFLCLIHSSTAMNICLLLWNSYVETRRSICLIFVTNNTMFGISPTTFWWTTVGAAEHCCSPWSCRCLFNASIIHIRFPLTEPKCLAKLFVNQHSIMECCRHLSLCQWPSRGQRLIFWENRLAWCRSYDAPKMAMNPDRLQKNKKLSFLSSCEWNVFL